MIATQTEARVWLDEDLHHNVTISMAAFHRLEESGRT